MDVVIHQLRESAEELAIRSRRLAAYEEEVMRISRYLSATGQDAGLEAAISCERLSGQLRSESAALGRRASALLAVADIYESRERSAGRYGRKSLPAVREYFLDDVRTIVRRYTEIRPADA